MAKWENCIGYGLLSERPAAGAQGALYFCSDTGAGYRDNGATWDQITGAGGLAPIETIVVSDPTDSLPFTGIPGTYRLLLLYLDGRGTGTTGAVNVALTINDDTGPNYDTQEMDTYNSTVEASTSLGIASPTVCQVPAASAPAGASGGCRLELPNYAGTIFQKRLTSLQDAKQGATDSDLDLEYQVIYWRNTAAISSLVLTIGAGNFVTGTTALLYGLS
jgi:hypothetical protein